MRLVFLCVVPEFIDLTKCVPSVFSVLFDVIRHSHMMQVVTCGVLNTMTLSEKKMQEVCNSTRVVKGVGHLDHVRSYGVREVVSSIPDRGNIVG